MILLLTLPLPVGKHKISGCEEIVSAAELFRLRKEGYTQAARALIADSKEASMFEPLEGGCLCGAVRYRVTAAPIDGTYCHCRMCQKSSGAPLQVSAQIPVEGFTLIQGEPKAYRSSDWAVRHFCPKCGSQLTFRAVVDPKYISINIPTLDRPGALAPRMQLWCSSRIPWFETKDDLPRYERAGPSVGA